jgi:energy-coupling factor transporter ATP-binding protein EcfA2
MTDVPHHDWEDFLERVFKWKQGEHVTLIGPTGQGKTFLAKAILPQRNYVVNFVTKKKDKMIGEFKREGYKVVKEWEHPHQSMNKILLQPPFAADEPRERHQRSAFKHALDRAFNETGWTVYLDEVLYVTDDLNLTRQVKRLWHQGRSLKVTVVAGTQRPALVPLLAYSQATHLFFWRNTDENDMRRLGSLGGLDRKTIQSVVGSLPKHEVLYLNTRTGELAQTKVRK